MANLEVAQQALLVTLGQHISRIRLINPGCLELLQQGQNGGSIGNALDGDTAFLNGADPRLSAGFLEGFSNATVTVYWVALAVVLVAFVLSFFLKVTPLRAKSALQENAEADLAVLAQEAADLAGAPVAPVADDEEPKNTAPSEGAEPGASTR